MRIDWQSFKNKFTKQKGAKFPTGTVVFKGFQGSGKTLSMVHYAFQLQKSFPDCLIYSNVKIAGLKNFHFLRNGDAVSLARALATRNGDDGVLVLIDEAHLFWHKKTGIPLDVLSAISQQRHDRKRLVFTSQIWEELDVSLRKQVKNVVSCRCLFHKFQLNTVSDGETIQYDKMQNTWTAKKLFTELFKHNDTLYSSYDTHANILTNTQYERLPTPETNISVFNQTKNAKKRP